MEVFVWYNALNNITNMYIQTFKEAAEANTFIDTVNALNVEYKENTIVVHYAPFMSEEEHKKQRLITDREEAVEGKVQAELQLKFLKKRQESGDSEVTDTAITTTEKNLAHYTDKLAVVIEALEE